MIYRNRGEEGRRRREGRYADVGAEVEGVGLFAIDSDNNW